MGLHANPKAAARLHAIQDAALNLVIAKGYDGFTMDELAEAVGVSRRTLFNYVPDKASAVLGPADEPDDARMVAFRTASRGGSLMEDLVALIDSFIDDVDDIDPGAIERHQLIEQAIASDVRVARMVMERFTALTQMLSDAVCDRQNWPRDDLRARAFAATFLALMRLTLEEFSRRPEAPIKDVFHSVLEADTAVRLIL